MIQDGKVQSHPSIMMHQKPLPGALDPKLELLVHQSECQGELTDPNVKMTHQHALAPLAQRAAEIEQDFIQGSTQVKILKTRNYI